MAYVMGKKQYLLSIAYGQSIITLLVILNVFYPQYLGYTFIIFVVSMIIFTAIMMKTQLKHIVGKEVKEIKEGRKLYVARPDEVLSLQKMDLQLINELKPMLKSTLMSFLTFIVFIIWYPTYFGYARSVAESITDVVTKVIIFLIGYEVPYAVITLINRLSQRALKEVVQVVSKYEVYDRGIVGAGITIKFPLNDSYSIKVNSRRRFLDIILSRGKVKVKYRFYSKNLSRLAEIIKRYGNPVSIEIER